MNFLACFNRVLHAHLLLKIPSDFERKGSVDLFVLISFYREVLVAFYLFLLVGRYDQVAVFSDPLHGVVLDTVVLIALGVHEKLLGTLLVLETDLVETASALR